MDIVISVFCFMKLHDVTMFKEIQTSFRLKIFSFYIQQAQKPKDFSKIPQNQTNGLNMLILIVICIHTEIHTFFNSIQFNEVIVLD